MEWLSETFGLAQNGRHQPEDISGFCFRLRFRVPDRKLKMKRIQERGLPFQDLLFAKRRVTVFFSSSKGVLSAKALSMSLDFDRKTISCTLYVL